MKPGMPAACFAESGAAYVACQTSSDTSLDLVLVQGYVTLSKITQDDAWSGTLP